VAGAVVGAAEGAPAAPAAGVAAVGVGLWLGTLPLGLATVCPGALGVAAAALTAGVPVAGVAAAASLISWLAPQAASAIKSRPTPTLPTRRKSFFELGVVEILTERLTIVGVSSGSLDFRSPCRAGPLFMIHCGRWNACRDTTRVGRSEKGKTPTAGSF
jgi:hypothetical protein